ncbi:MAG: HEAT repeat domain-containing protein [Bryobacteraceae bacterium]
MDSIILSAAEYPARTPLELLEAASRGFVGIDRRWLQSLIGRPVETVEAIERFSEDDHSEDPEELIGDFIRILRHLRSADALPYLVTLVEAAPEDVDYDLVAAFRDIGPASIGPLIELYRRVGKESLSEIAFILASAGVQDERVREVLLAHLEIDPVEAGHCLASYGDASVLPQLEAAAAAQAEDWKRKAMESAAQLLRSGEPADVEEEPFDLFAEYPSEADPRFEFLEAEEIEAFLKSPDAEYRAAAIEELTHDEVPKDLVAAIFAMAKQDPSPEVRGRAWEALSDALTDHPEILDAMRDRVLGDSYAIEDRCGALVALAPSQAHDRKFRAVILRFYDLPEARVKALEAMILAQEEDFIPYFSRHLEDADEVVRMQAIQGVGFYELTDEAERLTAAFSVESLREEALPCYALSAPAQMSRKGMQELYERIGKLAGELGAEEEQSVKDAINLRLARHEMGPLFSEAGELLAGPAVTAKVGRNDPCPCGSGKKYKKCCGA